MKKFLKWFIALAAIGSAVGLIIAYFCKGRCSDDCHDNGQDTEEEDFDLDSDLQPADREYVPLHRTADSVSDTPAAEAEENKEKDKETAGEEK